MQRFNSEIIAKDLFRVVKEKCGPNFSSLIAQKVTVVPGDITCENLGVHDSNLLEEMWKEVDVVVNLAATTNFDERYDVSLGINTMGAKHVLNFAKRCARMKVLLHVSTAYVSGEKEGLILETPYRMGETLNGTTGLDIDYEKKIIDEKLKELRAENATEQDIKLVMKDLGIQRARKFGWPNTYVFTKAMGEMLLGSLIGNIPLAIVRPTIVTSTYKEPFPGWVEGIRTIDSLAVGYAKGRLTCFLGDPNTIIDLIPADMVVNAMMAAMLTHINEPSEEPIIYQVGSSVSNPVLYSSLQEFGQRYFTKHPWVDKEGKPVKVGKITVLRTMESFHSYMALRYLLPLKGLKILNAALCQYFGGLYHDLYRKIKYVMRMIDLYGPYLFFKGVYDDMNTERLRQIIMEKGAENVFYFDPKCINWDDYFMNVHLPGIVKYVFK
ncbi:OLC1v1004534C2 [Oldenlandia corymbosa var. corymbosa]|nr:OLC1v1004534C2 [Oldenlandia corymbosa var. corymbosa]